MNLAQNARDLANQWHQTKTHWRDAKAIEFEKRYLEPLPGLVSKTTSIMTELDALIKKIRKDCEQL